MLVYHIDPAYLAAPSYPECSNSAERHIENVIELGRLARESVGLRVTCPSQTLEQLAMIGSFPLRNALAEMLELYGLVGVFSVEDLVKLYNRLLDLAQPLGELCGAAESEMLACVMFPDIFGSMSPADLAIFSRAAAGHVAAVEAEFSPAQAVFGSSLPPVDLGSADVGITYSDKIALDGVLPVGSYSMRSSIKLEHCPSLFGRYVDSFKLWTGAEDAKLLHLSICLKVMQLASKSGRIIGYFDVPKFFIGSEFFGSLKNNQGTGNGAYSSVVLETCARIVMGVPKSHVRNFQKDGAPMVRPWDLASAKRTHVTEKGDAMRLLYWSTAEGVEFANIGVKHEEVIELGNLQHRVG